MAYVFGVANHSPEVLIASLAKTKHISSNSEIAVHPVSTKLPSRFSSKYKCLLLLTVSDLVKNMPVLMSKPYDSVLVFVFAAPMKLNDVIGVQPLDYAPSAEHPGFGFTLSTLSLRPLSRLKTQSDLKRRNGRYLAKLITHVQSGSLLNSLMTFIYTLPSSAQTKMKLEIVQWLYAGKTDKELETRLASLRKDGISVTSKCLEKLGAILFTEVGANYRKAFAEYRKQKKTGKPPKLSAIVKEFGVVEYEMRYVLSVLGDAESAASYTDSYDKAKNRNR